MTPLYDSIIVGSGIGGLTAGLRLARKDHSVLFLEQSSRFGGLLDPFAPRRYAFDIGVHALGELGEGQSLRRLFDALGLVDLKFREIDPNCIDRYCFPDYETRLVKGVDRWADNLVKDFPREQDSIRQFVELMKECKELNRVAASGLSLSDLPGMLRYGGDLTRLSRLPMAALTERYFSDPLLRSVFGASNADSGLPPSRASAYFTINSLNHYLAGGFYPVGGSAAVRDAFLDALRAEGADLQRDKCVTTIRVLGEKRFEVFTADEQRYEARSVISDVNAKRTMAMLDNGRPGLFARRRVDKLATTPGAFCVFLATDLDLREAGIGSSTVYHYTSADLESDYKVLAGGGVPMQPSFWLTSATRKDPTTVRAPGGQQILQLFTYAPAAASDTAVRQLADRMIAGAQTYVPGLRDHIQFRETSIIPRPDHARGQSVLARLFTKVGIPGMFLAGSSVLGGGVMSCMNSGMLAAHAARVHLEQDAFGQLDKLSRAMSWVGRKAMLRSAPQKLHSNLHQLKRDRR